MTRRSSSIRSARSRRILIAGLEPGVAVTDFGVRGAPLEYWFVKLVAGELRLVVDWIVRLASGAAEIRVSLWVRGRGRVVHVPRTTWRCSGASVVIADCAFTPELVVGAVEDVRWELRCDPGRSRLDPVPIVAKLLRPFDLQLVARPRARFTGWVEVAGERFIVHEAAGTVNHYWGRRLPDSWVWVSADSGDGSDLFVEAAVLRTRIWGAPAMTVTGGYVTVGNGDRQIQVVAPVYGRTTAVGRGSELEIEARSWGRRIRLTARAVPESYNDLGEGIRQTLLGDVTVDGWGGCQGRAGVEVRGTVLTVSG